MNTVFDQLTALQVEWQSLQPLKTEQQDLLWRKFRLEWNYHSNHIEGNTLTYGETALLLLHDHTTGNHTHREYLEMKAHDVGIEHVHNLAKDKSRILTESDIRDLNKIILKEPFWKAAETADGQPTRKEIVPGQYKTTPNNVRLANGGIFYFASVEDTAPKMQALATWLGQELESPRLHPIALASKLHHEFVLIHPFDDGNGRVARLLVNYVLQRTGYPPVIVRTEDKVNYLTALQLADAGDLIPLTNYLARLAEWSLQLGIKAAKGESIAEASDIEKELAIFIRNQEEHQDKVKARSPEAVREIYDLGLKSLIEKINAKLQKLTPLFSDHSITVHPEFRETGNDPLMTFEKMIPRIERNPQYVLRYQFRGYKGQAPDPFAIEAHCQIDFGDFRYQIVGAGKLLVKKLYTEPIMSDEADTIATTILTNAFDQIKKLSGTK